MPGKGFFYALMKIPPKHRDALWAGAIIVVVVLVAALLSWMGRL